MINLAFAIAAIVTLGYVAVVLAYLRRLPELVRQSQGCPRLGDGSPPLALGIPRFAGRSFSITINSAAHRHISAISPIVRALFKPAVNSAFRTSSCLTRGIWNPHRINRPQFAPIL